MSFLDTLRAAFKGGGANHVPLARNFTSPWYFANDPAGARQPFDYTRDVARAFLDNPVAQRAVRIVSESLGNAPLAPMTPQVERLVRATSAGQSLLETLTATGQACRWNCSHCGLTGSRWNRGRTAGRSPGDIPWVRRSPPCGWRTRTAGPR